MGGRSRVGAWMDSQDSELDGDEKAKVGRRGQMTRSAVCSRDCGPELREDGQQAEQNGRTRHRAASDPAREQFSEPEQNPSVEFQQAQ